MPIVNVRFFGKIFGLRADYYIVEAKYESYEDVKNDEPLSRMEPPGVGANEYIYFATNHPETTWTLLPWVTPEMIQTSRRMRRFFSGNLMAPVLGYPRFPWGESAYLRAQLSRIACSTAISPKGYYAADEDAEDENAPLMPSDEWEVPAASEMQVMENWVHHRPYLLNRSGRVILYEDPNKDEEDDADDDKEEEEPEEPPAQLTSIEEDKDETLAKLKKIWVVRAMPKGAHPVVSATNFNWPGFVAVSKGNKWANIYVGFGHKYLAGLFTPPPPPTIMTEFKSVFDPEEEDEQDPLLEQTDPLPRPEKQGDEEDDEDDDEDDDD
jgi:radial spoke head protein 4A